MNKPCAFAKILLLILLNIVWTKARKGQTTVLKYKPFVVTPMRSSGIAIDDVRS